MEKINQKNATGQLDGFFFLGNHLALDFVNTRPPLGNESVELLADFGSLLRWFKGAGLLMGGEVKKLGLNWGGAARARHIVQAMRELREELRKQLLAWENGGAISPSIVAKLNHLMSRYPMLSRLKPVQHLLTIELWFEKSEPEQLFAPIAHHAAMLFANADRSRVRKCDHCVGHFLDTSKIGTRRWCSMRLCGNRAKVATYAARHANLTR